MSSSESKASVYSGSGEDSDVHYIVGYVLKGQNEDHAVADAEDDRNSDEATESNQLEPYESEPLADAEWLAAF